MSLLFIGSSEHAVEEATLNLMVLKSLQLVAVALAVGECGDHLPFYKGYNTKTTLEGVYMAEREILLQKDTFCAEWAGESTCSTLYKFTRFSVPTCVMQPFNAVF